MSVVAAAVVPHAPLIALGRAPRTEAAARRVLGALPEDPTWILLSPHGSRTAVRTEARGSLAPFGIHREEVAAASDPLLAGALTAGEIETAVPDSADQAVTVPLMLLDGPRTVVPLSFAEVTGSSAYPFDDVLGEVKIVADTIQEVGRTRDFVLVASAHTAATLTARGPLLERTEGHELHLAVLDALVSGTGMDEIPRDLWRAAGSCGAAPFSVLSRVCPGWDFEVASEEAPFGVGYVSALSIAL